MNNKTSANKQPLIQILEIGLKVWVRNQCKSISKLNIELCGSIFTILSGKLSSVKLIAERVNFKGLLLSEVELTSGPMELDIDLSNKKQKISFKKIFNIEGSISLTSENLKEIILSSKWEWIGSWLAENLLGVSNLESLEIEKEIIFLKGSGTELDNITVGEFYIEAKSGSLFFTNRNKDDSCLFPMDPSIYISQAIISNKGILISVRSSVNP